MRACCTRNDISLHVCIVCKNAEVRLPFESLKKCITTVSRSFPSLVEKRKRIPVVAYTAVSGLAQVYVHHSRPNVSEQSKDVAVLCVYVLSVAKNTEPIMISGTIAAPAATADAARAAAALVAAAAFAARRKTALETPSEEAGYPHNTVL